VTVLLDSDPSSLSTVLAEALQSALASGSESQLEDLASLPLGSRRDRFISLLGIYRLFTDPVRTLGDAARFQHHPAVAALKQRCEQEWLAELASIPLPDDLADREAADAMRVLAARDRLPAIYKWIAHEASWEDVVTFLALEGGPDAGFDDLVATCQIGLSGKPKLELATNYWDEMGNGDPAAVHTTLHEDLVSALGVPVLPLAGLPTSALERSALCGLLTTNRWLQPEALGALGFIELQAGPRCRLVLQAFDRCGAPAQAYPFYEVHAEVDPRHGRDWLDNAVTPITEETPEWSERVVRGAHWRAITNAAFFDDAAQMLRNSS
jgi:hypothetical protein